MEVISIFYDCIDKDVKILLDSKTSTQCHACGRVEKLRWYPYKKIGFSNVVKNNLKRYFRNCPAIFVAHCSFNPDSFIYFWTFKE